MVVTLPQVGYGFPLQSRPLYQRALWVSLRDDSFLSPSLCQKQRRIFLGSSPENLGLSMELQPMTVWGPPGTVAPGISPLR